MTDAVRLAGCLDDLRAVADRIGHGASEHSRSGTDADLAVKLFGTTMGAYLSHLWADPDHPVFLPSVGFYQMYGSPNPDTIYRTAVIDGSGEYVVTGHRGSVPDVSLMPFGPPTSTGLRTFEPFDLDDLAIGPDGTFQVSLSRRQPREAQNWWRLDPDMRTLMLRSVSEEWGRHIEPRLAITRLDVDPRRERFATDTLRSRLQSFAAVVEAMIMSGVNRVTDLRTKGIINRLIAVDYSQRGGRADQWYHEGCFSLGDDEVLLVEAQLQPGCRTFSLSLTDPLFSTIDWANAQSSLNRHQAVVDPDGLLRAVVAHSDPSVHNWLDTTGHPFGVLQCRWIGGREAPQAISGTPPFPPTPWRVLYRTPYSGSDPRNGLRPFGPARSGSSFALSGENHPVPWKSRRGAHQLNGWEGDERG